MRMQELADERSGAAEFDRMGQQAPAYVYETEDTQGRAVYVAFCAEHAQTICYGNDRQRSERAAGAHLRVHHAPTVVPPCRQCGAGVPLRDDDLCDECNEPHGPRRVA